MKMIFIIVIVCRAQHYIAVVKPEILGLTGPDLMGSGEDSSFIMAEKIDASANVCFVDNLKGTGKLEQRLE